MTDELLGLFVNKDMYVEWKTTSLESPDYEQRKGNYRSYDHIVKHSIESAKNAYLDNTFINYKNDLKNT